MKATNRSGSTELAKAHREASSRHFLVHGCLIGALLLGTAFPNSLLAATDSQKVERPNDRVEEPAKKATSPVEALAATARDSIVVMTYFGRDGEEEGVGTGFIISSNGLIATCQHVIGEARPIKVRLSDGREFEATAVEAWDRKLDLAIVKIDADNLPILPLGDSDTLTQGAAVVAMGNPMGMELSVVQGVVSARRDFDDQELIQLAIPIEPGNSGGPLLDLEGRVHGILNMKSALTRNLGFAIPINQLKPLIEKPNRVPIHRWLTIGALNPNHWESLFGARWSRKGGVIHVEEPGSSFGGRSLCLAQQDVPERPYEIAVTVKLDDESGAAGLVFGSDGDQKHYGFYPSSGQMRLTRFDGPSVFTWTILEQFQTPYYRPGDWNTIKVRREKDKILCYVNGHLVVESTDEGLPDGQIGLAKFRHTKAQFKKFRVSRTIDESDNPLPAELVDTIQNTLRSSPQLENNEASLVAALQPHADVGRLYLNEEAQRLELNAERLRRLAQKVHQQSVQEQLTALVNQPEPDIDLMKAALLIAKLDNPDLEMESYLQQLQQMAEEILETAPNASQSELLQTMSDYLFQQNGFHGSRSDYYNRANSYISQVLDDREGIPITLSVLFMELATRIGLKDIFGVPFPGHFMVKHAPAEGPEQLIDVYEGGTFLSREEAEERVQQTAGFRLRESHLEPATKQEILVRMLRNLQRIAEDKGTVEDELKYNNMILALIPESSMDRFQRAGLYLRNRDGDAARQDLKWLLDHQPPGLDLDRIAEIYRSLDSAQ